MRWDINETQTQISVESYVYTNLVDVHVSFHQYSYTLKLTLQSNVSNPEMMRIVEGYTSIISMDSMTFIVTYDIQYEEEKDGLSLLDDIEKAYSTDLFEVYRRISKECQRPAAGLV